MRVLSPAVELRDLVLGRVTPRVTLGHVELFTVCRKRGPKRIGQSPRRWRRILM